MGQHRVLGVGGVARAAQTLPQDERQDALKEEEEARGVSEMPGPVAFPIYDSY